MTGDAASAPVRGRVREIAAWGALGPAAIALFWAAAEQWPKGGNAWQGLAGGAAVCLVLGAYLGGGVKAGETLDAGPGVAGALGVTHLAIGLIALLSPVLMSPAGDPCANWIGRILFTYLALAGVLGVPLVAFVAFLFARGQLRLSSVAAMCFLLGTLSAAAVVTLTYAVTASFDTGSGAGPYPGPVIARDVALRVSRLVVAVLSGLAAFVIGTAGLAGSLRGRS